MKVAITTGVGVRWCDERTHGLNSHNGTCTGVRPAGSTPAYSAETLRRHAPCSKANAKTVGGVPALISGLAGYKTGGKGPAFLSGPRHIRWHNRRGRADRSLEGDTQNPVIEITKTLASRPGPFTCGSENHRRRSAVSSAATAGVRPLPSAPSDRPPTR